MLLLLKVLLSPRLPSCFKVSASPEELTESIPRSAPWICICTDSLEKRGFRAVPQMLKLSYLLFYSPGHSKACGIAVTYDLAWRSLATIVDDWKQISHGAPNKSDGSHSVRLWSMAWSPWRTVLLSDGSGLTVSFWSRRHTCRLLGETMDNVAEPSLVKEIKQIIASVRARPVSGGETLLTLPLFFKAAVQRPAFSFKMRRERRSVDKRLLRLHHCWRYFCISILRCIRCCCMCKGTFKQTNKKKTDYWHIIYSWGWKVEGIYLFF